MRTIAILRNNGKQEVTCHDCLDGTSYHYRGDYHFGYSVSTNAYAFVRSIAQRERADSPTFRARAYLSSFYVYNGEIHMCIETLNTKDESIGFCYFTGLTLTCTKGNPDVKACRELHDIILSEANLLCIPFCSLPYGQSSAH